MERWIPLYRSFGVEMGINYYNSNSKTMVETVINMSAGGFQPI
jgi:hypothetical protein